MLFKKKQLTGNGYKEINLIEFTHLLQLYSMRHLEKYLIIPNFSFTIESN